MLPPQSTEDGTVSLFHSSSVQAAWYRTGYTKANGNILIIARIQFPEQMQSTFIRTRVQLIYSIQFINYV